MVLGGGGGADGGGTAALDIGRHTGGGGRVTAVVALAWGKGYGRRPISE